MTLTLLDRSNYLKGLLILMGRDRIIHPREREHILRACRILDFETRFCTAAIDDLLRNRHITHDPVIFSERHIAECFLRDGIRLSLIDNEIHPHEFAWLKGVALANGLSEEWLALERQRFLERGNSRSDSDRFAIQQYL